MTERLSLPGTLNVAYGLISYISAKDSKAFVKMDLRIIHSPCEYTYQIRDQWICDFLASQAN